MCPTPSDMAESRVNSRCGSAANLQVTAIVTGALAVVLGGDVFWSLIALGLGQVIGGAVMALHGHRARSSACLK